MSVDQYRDRIFENLLAGMTQQATFVSPGLQFILATRHLERIADHATNIAEDIIFWVRGLDCAPRPRPELAPRALRKDKVIPNSPIKPTGGAGALASPRNGRRHQEFTRALMPP